MFRHRQDTGIVCGKQNMEGIRIFSHLICSDCESEMVSTDVHDEKYPYFINKLRTIWYRKDA